MIEKRLTVRVKPYPNESLLSYLLRLAGENGMTIHGLLNIIKSKETMQLRREHLSLINLFPQSILDIKKTAYLTLLDEEEILGLSASYLLKVFSNSFITSRCKFISGILRESLFYCPQCLKEKPYYKLVWSISNIEVCTIHKEKLTNICMHCKSEIVLKDLLEVNHCPYCKKVLSESYSHT